MIEYSKAPATRPATRIVGPFNEVLTRDSLPPPDTTRWVASRKAQVVAAVQSGLISLEEVMQRYGLSHEEFFSWQRAMDRAGVSGLRVAWSQEDRASRRRHRAEPPAAARRLQIA